jgi:hypothetical protein
MQVRAPVEVETYDFAEIVPQWRGPAGNGLVLHGNPPLEWSEEQNVKWKVPVPGRGHATPIIWEDRSKTLWQRVARLGSNPVPMAVADHEQVYLMSGHRNPAAFAVALGGSGDLTGTHAVRWRIERGTAYQ